MTDNVILHPLLTIIVLCFLSKKISKIPVILFIGLSLVTQETQGQNTPDKLREKYLTPPGEILKQVLAPRYENVFLSDLDPKRKYFVNYIGEDNFTSITQYAHTFYNLGGLEIDPVANRKRTLTDQTPDPDNKESGTGLLLTNAGNGEARVIHTPATPRISYVKWSPDGKRLAYFASFKDATYPYIADVGSGRSKRITARLIMRMIR